MPFTSAVWSILGVDKKRRQYLAFFIHQTVAEKTWELMIWRTDDRYYIEMLVAKEGEHLQATIDVYKKY